MAYENWLKRKEWQKRRLYIFERDNFKCQCSTCKTPNSTLEVHHIEYLSYDLKPWEYPDDMLITLCHVCHSKENSRSKIEEELSVCLKMKGFLYSDISALVALAYSHKSFTTDLLTRLRNMRNG